ncbi:MAG: hypothetical protein KJN94_03300 [Gammaproteobacteria bacterium]|nr:hypothetical protein [Gammaproteobacteria bacterium]
MKHCAFLTLDERGDFVIDDEHAIGPLADLGWRVSTLSWRQQATPWSAFDAVVIRSTWDYWNDVDEFLGVLERIDRQTRLANPLPLVHWNLAKTYLRDLEDRGVPVVPTLWPGRIDATGIRDGLERLGSREGVVKPVIGANGEDAYRVSLDDSDGRLTDVSKPFAGRQAMLQPFMARVIDEGEFSLFYFNGAFSHAILKVPAASEFRSQEERGAEIRPVLAEQQLLQRGGEAIATLAPAPLYARIDFVRDRDGDFRVMEMELIEPSLYLRTDPGAPLRFAEAIDRYFD